MRERARELEELREAVQKHAGQREDQPDIEAEQQAVQRDFQQLLPPLAQRKGQLEAAKALHQFYRDLADEMVRGIPQLSSRSPGRATVTSMSCVALSRSFFLPSSLSLSLSLSSSFTLPISLSVSLYCSFCLCISLSVSLSLSLSLCISLALGGGEDAPRYICGTWQQSPGSSASAEKEPGD